MVWFPDTTENNRTDVAPDRMFCVGMRVRVNDTMPYSVAGREGTVLKLSWEISGWRGKSEWIVVGLDDNPDHPVEWHRNYFDPI